MLNPPDGTAPRQVNVHDEADWQVIYKTPSIRVKCLLEDCDTLLTPKRMSRSGLRFLAIRSGGCSHNLVTIPVLDSEVEQDPSTLVGGGGPEGDEHLWVKGRLFRVARKLGLDPIEEDRLTHADVYLSKPGIALEYQRWDTDFVDRTEQRSASGASSTLWLFPEQEPSAQRTKRSKAFRKQVWEAGGVYVAVKNHNDRSERLRPWENPEQEYVARLYVSGSIVWYDPKVGYLVRRELSIATVLSEIASGERDLKVVQVYTKGTGTVHNARVWVSKSDYRKAQAMLEAGRQTQQARERAAAADAAATNPPAPIQAPAHAPAEPAARRDSPAQSPKVRAAEAGTPSASSEPGPAANPFLLPAAETAAQDERAQTSTKWWTRLLRLLRG